MERPEIRQNKVTREWVIYAPNRGQRPRDFEPRSSERKDLPVVVDPACPFCPGNEDRLEEIVLELPGPKTGTWHTRVVPNKFPALVPDGGAQREHRGIYLALPGYGRHEVIIESPIHSQQLAAMSPAEVEVVVETYHRRYVDLMRRHGNLMGIIFRNHGGRAGTSLIHPHSQLVVTGVVPSDIRRREEQAQRYYDEYGRCVTCDVLRYEASDRTRVLRETEDFLVFIPFAAEVPFEIWIVPKRHQADFGQIGETEKAGLARALHGALAGLYRKLDDPDYNYVIHTSARYRSGEPQLHWYLEIRPRLTTRAGFEIGSGISINPSLPERDAAFLRGN